MGSCRTAAKNSITVAFLTGYEFFEQRHGVRVASSGFSKPEPVHAQKPRKRRRVHRHRLFSQKPRRQLRHGDVALRLNPADQRGNVGSKPTTAGRATLPRRRHRSRLCLAPSQSHRRRRRHAKPPSPPDTTDRAQSPQWSEPANPMNCCSPSSTSNNGELQTIAQGNPNDSHFKFGALARLIREAWRIRPRSGSRALALGF